MAKFRPVCTIKCFFYDKNNVKSREIEFTIPPMSEIRTKVQFVDIDEDMAGQRIDNFLRNQLKDIPKSMIYRIVRKGEVRVNKKRIKAEYKLKAGDLVRIPPVTVEKKDDDVAPSTKLNKVAELEDMIIFEDDHMLILNKPSGTAVHGGSGLKFGAIEALRALRPQARFLELLFTLVSNCLIINRMIRIVTNKIVVILTSKRLPVVNNNKMMEVQSVTHLDASIVFKRDRNDWPLCDSVFKLIKSTIYEQL